MRMFLRAPGALLLLAQPAAADPMDDIGSFFNQLTHIGDSKPEQRMPDLSGKKEEPLFTINDDSYAKQDQTGGITIDEADAEPAAKK